MSPPQTLTAVVPFPARHGGNRSAVLPRRKPASLPGRVPRVARLMALALRWQGLLQQGDIRSYAELARLGQVSRSRISQIMNLLHLAPDLQEELLELPRSEHGRDPLHLGQLQALAATPDWDQQRRLWAQLRPPGA